MFILPIAIYSYLHNIITHYCLMVTGRLAGQSRGAIVDFSLDPATGHASGSPKGSCVPHTGIIIFYYDICLFRRWRRRGWSGGRQRGKQVFPSLIRESPDLRSIFFIIFFFRHEQLNEAVYYYYFYYFLSRILYVFLMDKTASLIRFEMFR